MRVSVTGGDSAIGALVEVVTGACLGRKNSQAIVSLLSRWRSLRKAFHSLDPCFDSKLSRIDIPAASTQSMRPFDQSSRIPVGRHFDP